MLLVLEARVGSDEDFEPFAFGGIEQFTIPEL